MERPMFCTSAPLSTTAPRPRVRRGSIADEMAIEIRERVLAGDCATEEDLERAGFTKAEIAAHAEAAKASVRRSLKVAA
jgi:hypothetical protein